jgi:hypothetical protein
MTFIQSIKPKSSKHSLLYIAAFVWMFAGSMLLFKGFFLIGQIKHYLWFKSFIAFVGGIMFYIVLFSKISLKHTKRIINLEIDHPCAFSFFNYKSYILMAIMITLGILLRRSGLLETQYLCVFYLIMGIPLFISGFRFLFFGIRFR